MTHVARPASIGTEISPVYAPASSWWTFCAPTPTSSPGERVAHGGEAHVRRTDHPGDARLPRARRDRPREVPGVGGGGVHLPVGGNHDRAHGLIMPEAPGPPAVPSARRPRPVRPPPRRAARCPRRRGARAARAGRAPAGPRTGGGRGARRSRTATPRASRGGPPPRPAPSAAARRAARPPRARRSRPAAGPAAATRALEVGALGVDDPVEVARGGSGRRSAPRARGGWRCRRSGPRNAAIDSALFQVTTPRPRRSRHDAGRPDLREPPGEDRRLVRRDDELEVGPARGEAQRAAGEEPAAEPREAAVVRRPSPRRTRPRGRTNERPALAGRARARRAGRSAGRRRPRGVTGCGPRPGDLGDAGRTAGTGRRPRAPRAAPRRGRDRSPTSARPQAVRPARATAGGGGWPPSRSQAPMIAVASRLGSWWWALAGSTRSSRTSRGGVRRRPAASAGGPARRASRRAARR